jgi:hypothetical protein
MDLSYGSISYWFDNAQGLIKAAEKRKTVWFFLLYSWAGRPQICLSTDLEGLPTGMESKTSVASGLLTFGMGQGFPAFCFLERQEALSDPDPESGLVLGGIKYK